jgi:protein-S-isoprenylcysteine O-methyltransferase Ste14
MSDNQGLSIVRNPIDAGMFGMVTSTGKTFCIPVWVAIAKIVAWCGTYLRIQSKEA